MSPEQTMDARTPAAAGGTILVSGGETPAPPDPAAKRLATAALLAAVLLGMLGDGLLRTEGMGINMPLWVAGALVATWCVARARGHEVRPVTWAFGLPVLFFASVFAWRAAPPLYLLNMLAMLTGFGVLAFALSGWPRSLLGAGIPQYLLGAASLGVSAVVGGPLLVLTDGGLSQAAGRPRRAEVFAVARGLLIALPLLAIFGALLSAADARFEELLDTLIAVDFAETMQHVVFAGFVAWVAAGYLRAAVVARRPLGVDEVARGLPAPRLGIVELGVALGLLDLLFLAFVILQLPYLFGGASHLQQAASLTAASYARRGFYELVVVAALVLPVLVVGTALVDPRRPRDARIFRVLGLTTILLVALMMASALQRMGLYAAAFGLTEDRIYATAIMIWLALVFVLFAATGLRRRPAGFVLGAIACGWLVVAALDFANPQAIVVRTNVERAAAGARFDAPYVASLGSDAVPALADALARLDDGSRCTIGQKLRRVAAERELGLPTDWRWWNASRTTAHRVARRATQGLHVPACTTEPAAP